MLSASVGREPLQLAPVAGHRHPFGLLGSTGCPSSKRHPHPSVPRQPASAVAISLGSRKGCGKWGFKNHCDCVWNGG